MIKTKENPIELDLIRDHLYRTDATNKLFVQRYTTEELYELLSAVSTKNLDKKALVTYLDKEGFLNFNNAYTKVWECHISDRLSSYECGLEILY